MKITNEQMTLMREGLAQVHAGKICRFLRVRYPESVEHLSDADMFSRIRAGVRGISDAGVADSRAAALFVVTQFVAGPTFFLHPACARLLGDRRLPPDARVLSLFHGDADIPWGEIAATRDNSAWFGDCVPGFAR
jgi:hypothetical protein